MRQSRRWRRCVAGRAAPIPPARGDYHAYQAGGEQSDPLRRGRIGARSAHLHGPNTGVGGATGAVLGGVAGSHVGGGSGQVVGAVGRHAPGRHARLEHRAGGQRASRHRDHRAARFGPVHGRRAGSRRAVPVRRPRARPLRPRPARASRINRRRAARSARLRWTRIVAARRAGARSSCASLYPARDARAAPRAACGGGRAKLLRILGVERAGRGRAAGRAARRGAMIAANHVSWLDIFADLERAPDALRRQERDPRLAARRLDRRARRHALHPPRPAPRHRRASTSSCTTCSREGDCVGLFPGGHHDRGRRAAASSTPRSSSRRSRTRAHVHPVRDPLRARRRHALPRRWPSSASSRSCNRSALILRQRGVRRAHHVRADRWRPRARTRREVGAAAQARDR